MMRLEANIILKYGLYLGVLILMFLPMAQNYYGFIESKPLKGSFTKLEDTTLTVDGWLSGNYQLTHQDYIDQNIGFRNVLVRTYNQMHYSLFDNARANQVVVGKDNYLYEENYIKAHLGRDFVGQKEIVERVRKLKKISEELKVNGIDLIVLLAPGKGSFYPEYIPDFYEPERKTITNYEGYRDEMLDTKINILDFNQWFVDMKSTSPHPLYAKNGIHWSRYGEVLVADSIIGYIGNLRNVDMPELVVKSKVLSDSAQFSDDDIERGMNLLFDIPDLEMAYPVFKIEKSKTSNPKVLTIADSYFWGIFNMSFSKKVFDKGKFWYYNKKIYPDSYEKSLKVKDVDIIEEVEKNDVVLIICTDANLHKFAFGFIDQLYDAYKANPAKKRTGGKDSDKDKKTAKENRIEYFVNAIKTSAEWLESVKEDAKEKNITLDEAIMSNAKYMVWQEGKKK
ncbi:MAG: hypothetical protein HRT71_08150 [Flavobacteriales bacterium]|nr:hypothetical protein [Flavobacteriales bacterium]